MQCLLFPSQIALNYIPDIFIVNQYIIKQEIIKDGINMAQAIY